MGYILKSPYVDYIEFKLFFIIISIPWIVYFLLCQLFCGFIHYFFHVLHFPSVSEFLGCSFVFKNKVKRADWKNSGSVWVDGGREVRLAVAFGKMPEVRLLSGELCYPHSLSSSLYSSLEKMSSGLLFCMPEACRSGGRMESQLFYISTIT